MRAAVIKVILWLAEVHRQMLAVYFAAIGPRAAYAVSGAFARLLYWLLPPLRARSEAQCRAALGARATPEQLPCIAATSFVHRVWNLTDLFLAERFLLPTTHDRYGGRLPGPLLRELLAAQARRQPAILLSAYYGPYDLLPLFIGYQGVQAAVLYQPHENVAFDAQRRRIRMRGGCTLVPVEAAVSELPRILAAGGTIAVIADHHADRRGLPVTFLGLPTLALRTVGLLAWRFDADIVVAGIQRLQRSFQFKIRVPDVIYHAEWAGAADPVVYITNRYLRALERLVLCDPSQYPWAYARWGEDLARRLTADGYADASQRPRGPTLC